MSGWNILACGDQAMPMNMDGVNDMFYSEKFDFQAYSDWCFATYGLRPDYDYTLNHFGGVTDKEYLAASHIIFTNGGLDPWSGASPTKTLGTTLPSCYIRNYWLSWSTWGTPSGFEATKRSWPRRCYPMPKDSLGNFEEMDRREETCRWRKEAQIRMILRNDQFKQHITWIKFEKHITFMRLMNQLNKGSNDHDY